MNLHYIKPILGILLLVGFFCFMAWRCKKETGSFKPFLKGSLYGLGYAAFMLLVCWLIYSEAFK
jgi:hypothetical protein